MCFGSSTLKPSYNSRGCVCVYCLSCNYNMFVSPVMVTKKRLKERAGGLRLTKQTTLVLKLIDQEVAGGLQYDQQI